MLMHFQNRIKLLNLSTTIRLLTRRYLRVLGIETSCDDTAVAIVDDSRRILSSRRYNSPHLLHQFGGICPELVADQHRQLLMRAINECVDDARLRFADLDAIAVSRAPGLIVCLKVGVTIALALCRRYCLPLVDCHHMQAHALTVRLEYAAVPFPFLCLLMSGAHCLLVLVDGADRYRLVGSALKGTAPGELLDKVARGLRLHQRYPTNVSGGHAVELTAETVIEPDAHLRFCTGNLMLNRRDCTMDFHGLKGYFMQLIGKYGDDAAAPPLVGAICASAQHAVFRQMAIKLQRVIELIDDKQMLASASQRTLVLAGGVAANRYIRSGLSWLAKQYQYETVCPSRRLCTDNGEMIAWMGIELIKCKSNRVIDRLHIPDRLVLQDTAPIGEDISQSFNAERWRIQKRIDLDSRPWIVI